MYMPLAALAQSIAGAAMPTFSAQAALAQNAELRTTLDGALRGVILLAMPAAVGLILLREPLITLLYQNDIGFTAQSTRLVAWALLWYAVGLPAHALLEVAARVFYAYKDTRTPVMVGAGAMGLNIAFSFAFSALFSRLGWMPHGGLALANSLATALEVALLLFLLRRRLGGLEYGAGRAAAEASIACAGMVMVLWGWMNLGAKFPAWLLAPGGAGLGVLVYALILLARHNPDITILLRSIWRRFGHAVSPDHS
jgi:putative peptidoglycan lipid II flippase